MPQRLGTLIVGCLALIGGLVIAVNVGLNIGGVDMCGSAKETASVSPDGESVLVIGISECGSKKQTMARILAPEKKTYLVFLGSAESADPILTAQWLGQNQLQLSYSPSAALKFPPENLEGVNVFGEVEVKYKQR